AGQWERGWGTFKEETRERGWGAFKDDPGLAAALLRALEHAKRYVALDETDMKGVFKALDPAQTGQIEKQQIERVARGMQLPPELTAEIFFSFVAKDKAGAAGDKAVAVGDKAVAVVDEASFLAAHRHARAFFEEVVLGSGGMLELWERQVIAHVSYMRSSLAELEEKDRAAAFLALERTERDHVARRMDRGLLQESIMHLGAKEVRQFRRELSELDDREDKARFVQSRNASKN
ncbi:hypothetical protein T484DRAFT_1821890, partial [Baffinella frigidus]